MNFCHINTFVLTPLPPSSSPPAPPSACSSSCSSWSCSGPSVRAWSRKNGQHLWANHSHWAVFADSTVGILFVMQMLTRSWLVYDRAMWHAGQCLLMVWRGISGVDGGGEGVGRLADMMLLCQIQGWSSTGMLHVTSDTIYGDCPVQSSTDCTNML